MILVARARQPEVVTAACRQTLELGLCPGMAAAHARALAPSHLSRPDRQMLLPRLEGAFLPR